MVAAASTPIAARWWPVTTPGRRRIDDVLLVEVLGTREIDVELACRIHQVVLEHGLEGSIPEND
jgi:hypothetical protein